MITHLQYALLIALCGTETLFLLKGSHLRSSEEKALKEASEYTIIEIQS